MRVDLIHSEMLFREDGVLQINVRDHNYITKDLKEINAAQGKITNGGKCLVLVIGSEFANIDSEAREYMASDESTQYSIAEAYVIRSLAHKILANFYLKVNKPGVPTKFFSDAKLAEEWLRTYLPSVL